MRTYLFTVKVEILPGSSAEAPATCKRALVAIWRRPFGLLIVGSGRDNVLEVKVGQDPSAEQIADAVLAPLTRTLQRAHRAAGEPSVFRLQIEVDAEDARGSRSQVSTRVCDTSRLPAAYVCEALSHWISSEKILA